jgi:outer membrane protein assembly factor BamB/lysophospholipase L1-like esterase
MRRTLALFAVLAARLWAAASVATPVSPSPADWRSYLGDDTRTHHSALAQITPGNVARLEPAWTYRAETSGGARPWGGNPLVIRSRLFATTPSAGVVALDAATGAELWRFAVPDRGGVDPRSGEMLGVAAWTDEGESRVFFVNGHRLGALAPADGKPVAAFGHDGFVDFAPRPPGENARGPADAIAPPTVLHDRVIVAGDSLNAYDVRTGARVWNVDSPCDGVIAADAARNRIYFISGQSLLSLDGQNGEEVWRRELPSEHALVSPVALTTVRRNGDAIPAVICATRSGRVLPFHRLTGEALASTPDGIAVIPPEDAAATAGAPAADPDNRVYLAARGRAFAAADLAAGYVAWRTHPRMGSAGGDPIVTGSGLLFRGTKEGFHAIDAHAGVPLWRGELAAEPTGTPATYFADGRQFVVIPAGDALVAFALPADAVARPPPPTLAIDRFEEDIRRLEANAARKPLPPEGIAFLGSSTFARWNIAAAFPDLPVANLGFGGSQITDINHYAARLLLPLRPRIVVFYGGSNDIGANFSPEEVAQRYRVFATWMDENLPECDVVVLGNLPTPSRWAIWPQMHELNTRLAEETRRHPRHHYVDGAAVMLDADGHLRRDRISSDNLHLNAVGNIALRDLLRPAIDAIRRNRPPQD